MARFTTAYSSFVSRLDEVECLRRLAETKERLDPVGMRADISALCRGSVVLLSSHLEAYIKELGEIALDSLHTKHVDRATLTPRFFYHLSKEALDEIKNTSDPEKLGEKIFQFIGSEGQYWVQSGSFPTPLSSEKFNKGFSNPAFSKTQDYFKRFGYSEYQSDLKRKLTSHFLPTKNMIDHLVDVRNKIAHGDPLATKTPADVRDMITIVKVFCMATDSVFAKWWKSNYCAIR